jgi:hypothetical protein
MERKDSKKIKGAELLKGVTAPKWYGEEKRRVWITTLDNGPGLKSQVEDG